jgi:hypothetical protein
MSSSLSDNDSLRISSLPTYKPVMKRVFINDSERMVMEEIIRNEFEQC